MFKAKETHPYSLGYWVCGQHIFHSKHLAAIHASQTNQSYQYIFNDSFLETANWQLEPVESIQSLYTRRAIQLREKYDHLILFYSGGADSKNILRTFLDNNIQLDEVVSWGAWNHRIDKHSHNLNSEIFQAGCDDIQEVINKGWTFTHINYLDIFDNVYHDIDWVYQSDWRLTPESEFRRKIFYHRPAVIKLIDQGKSVGLIFGRDKPRILLHNGKLCWSALDLTMGQDLYPEIFDPEFSGPITEWFYSTPDLPEIMIKQSHMIANWYLRNYSPADIQKLLSPDTYDPDYYEKINLIIYPHTWHSGIFTVGKGDQSTSVPYYHKSSFFYSDMKDTRQKQIWNRGVDMIYNSIAPNLKNIIGITGRWSSFYPLTSLPLGA
jgi:hypothetical protein